MVNKDCACYTATTWASDSGCPAFKPSKPCIVPLCARMTTTMLPGRNPRCAITPTKTSLIPCETTCRHDCAVYTSTVTAPSPCLPSTSPTSFISRPALIGLTITPPLRSRSCYTETVSATDKCPEDEMGCPPPDCIWLSTTLVPPDSVVGCESTPTLTRSRTCLGRCDGSCGTQWVTETATAW